MGLRAHGTISRSARGVAVQPKTGRDLGEFFCQAWVRARRNVEASLQPVKIYFWTPGSLGGFLALLTPQFMQHKFLKKG
jgi:hypothetical protein